MKATIILCAASFVGATDWTLRQAAEGTGIFVGAAINYDYHLQDADYTAMAAKEYSLITAENACKMNQIAKSYTEYDFGPCKTMVEYAKKNGQHFRGHNLIWGAPRPIHNPPFVYNETNATKLEEYLNEYIDKTVKEIGEDAFVWDVVNEAVADSAEPFYKVSPWSIVDDYICKAFKAAHKANPKAKLFYNDYKHASSTGRYKLKSNKVYEMVKNMTERGCPIHGIGFQNHLDIEYSDENFDAIRANIKRYHDLGIIVHFTESDVRCKQFGDKKCNYTGDWPKEALERQAEIYGKFLQVCLEEPNCMSYETWGFTDRRTSLPADQKALPFDSDLKPKLAATKLYETLVNFPRDHPSAVYKIVQGNGESQTQEEAEEFLQ